MRRGGIALGIATVVSLGVYLATSVAPFPMGIVELLDRHFPSAMGVRGGQRLTIRPTPNAADVSTAVRETAERVRGFWPEVEIRPSDTDIVLDLIGATPRAADYFRRAATSLRLQLEDDRSDYMQRVAERIEADPATARAGVYTGRDTWSAEADPRAHATRYVTTSNRPLLDMYLLGLARRDPSLRMPAGRELLYELTSPRTSDKLVFRTHLVFSEILLDQSSVEGADVMWDEVTNDPQVLLTFTADGRERFASVTSAHVGEKLAVVSCGEVAMAPVIQQVIRGGKATITMGRGEPRALLAAAMDLRDTLRASAAMRGATVTAATTIEPRVSKGALVVLRAGAALLAGALVFIAIRLTRRRRPR